MSKRSGRAYQLIALAALALAMFAGSPARPQQSDAPPTKAVLRLNTTGHTAEISGIATDRKNRYVVTASLDKTARVWSLEDNSLLTVLRVPIDEGEIGELRAVAITPDGSTVALGGWTSAPETPKNIYFLDRASGALQRRLSGLPDVVDHLAYSSDGRLLAATLARSNGIRVYDVSRGYEPLPSDTAYSAFSYWADFDPQGRLVTTSGDGFIRLYAAREYGSPIAKVKGRGGSEPNSAVFSPDGQRVAVGYSDSTAVDLLSGLDLAFIVAADTSGVAGPNLSKTAWSLDGRYLFAGGINVRRWQNDNSRQHIDIEAAKSHVTELLPLWNGDILFGLSGSADPPFGLIDMQGHAKMLQGPGRLDFSGDGLRVSREGGTVQGETHYPPHILRFALAERRLDIDPQPDDTLTALQRRSQNAGAPVVATNHVRQNVTPDGRLVVWDHPDGTIRWSRARDGEELLALWVDPDGKRWILWTPQGYFDASVGADELIGWQVNHGFDQTPDFFPVSRFRDRFYRPDVIAKVLDTLDVDEAVRQADKDAGRMTAKAAPITQTLPPVVQIAEPAQKTTVTETQLKVTYSARAPTDDPVTRVEAQIDARKTEADERVLSAGGETRVGILTIELPRRDAMVSVIAYNKNGPSEPASVQITWAGRGSEPKPKLYILAIGVENYQDQSLNLRFPAKDADDFVEIVKDHTTGLYETVIVGPRPSDGRWTHDAVLDGLDWIRKEPTNKDVAMIFVSGHAVVTPDQVYRFLPFDYDVNRIERTSVRAVEFQDFLSKVDGKVLVFLDTCYAGDVLHGSRATPITSQDKFANELAAAENGVVVFASSTGNQLSWEDPAWGNGAFTKALVEGLGGKADATKSGVVRISGLEGYVYDRVKELIDGKQKPMVAKPKMVENFPIVVVAQ